MDKDRFINYVAAYFYIKGYGKGRFGSDQLDLDTAEYKQLMDDCFKSYQKVLEDERKDSPHHHTNRLD